MQLDVSSFGRYISVSIFLLYVHFNVSPENPFSAYGLTPEDLVYRWRNGSSYAVLSLLNVAIYR